MRTPQELWSAMPDWARQIVDDAAAEHKVTRHDILGESRAQRETVPRHLVWLRAHQARPKLSSKRLENIFGHDSSSIRHALRKLKGARRARDPQPAASCIPAE